MHGVDVVGLENAKTIDQAPGVEVDQAGHGGHKPGFEAAVWWWCERDRVCCAEA